MSKRRFIIDSDTASDDAVAILMALQWPDVVVEAITIVSGNMPVAQGSINARYTVELCGQKTPVYEGCTRPLVKPAVHADWFHGPDGMGGMNYPAPGHSAEAAHAVPELIRRFGQAPGDITLVTLGPLTNIALALRQEPRLAHWIKEIIIMGGTANSVGNVTPAAEYNIWCDPEAAQIVFDSGAGILMVGWEQCRGEAALTTADMQHCYDLGTPLADFAIDCNKHALEACIDWLGDPGLLLPDPVAIVCALDPTICTRRSQHHVTIALDGPARGMTIVDQLGVGQVEPNIDPYWINKQPNVDICWQIDPVRWKEAFYKTLRQ